MWRTEVSLLTCKNPLSVFGRQGLPSLCVADGVKALKQKGPQPTTQCTNLLSEWLAVTQMRKRGGEEEEWKGVRYSTSESAAAWRTFCHGNKYPSHPPSVSLFPTRPPLSLRVSVAECTSAPLSDMWCQWLMPILQFPRLIIQTGLGGGEELALPSRLCELHTTHPHTNQAAGTHHCTAQLNPFCHKLHH